MQSARSENFNQRYYSARGLPWGDISKWLEALIVEAHSYLQLNVAFIYQSMLERKNVQRVLSQPTPPFLSRYPWERKLLCNTAYMQEDCCIAQCIPSNFPSFHQNIKWVHVPLWYHLWDGKYIYAVSRLIGNGTLIFLRHFSIVYVYSIQVMCALTFHMWYEFYISYMWSPIKTCSGTHKMWFSY